MLQCSKYGFDICNAQLSICKHGPPNTIRANIGHELIWVLIKRPKMLCCDSNSQATHARTVCGTWLVFHHDDLASGHACCFCQGKLCCIIRGDMMQHKKQQTCVK